MASAAPTVSTDVLSQGQRAAAAQAFDSYRVTHTLREALDAGDLMAISVSGPIGTPLTPDARQDLMTRAADPAANFTSVHPGVTAATPGRYVLVASSDLTNVQDLFTSYDRSTKAYQRFQAGPGPAQYADFIAERQAMLDDLEKFQLNAQILRKAQAETRLGVSKPVGLAMFLITPNLGSALLLTSPVVFVGGLAVFMVYRAIRKHELGKQAEQATADASTMERRIRTEGAMGAQDLQNQAQTLESNVNTTTHKIDLIVNDELRTVTARAGDDIHAVATGELDTEEQASLNLVATAIRPLAELVHSKIGGSRSVDDIALELAQDEAAPGRFMTRDGLDRNTAAAVNDTLNFLREPMPPMALAPQPFGPPGP